MTFQEFLTEAGKNVAEANWIKTPRNWKGIFILTNKNVTGSFEIDISIRDYCDTTDVWEFSFTRDKKASMANDGLFGFIIYPTINKAIRDFLSEVNPETFGFLGDKNDKSRDKVYGSTSKILSSSYDYKFWMWVLIMLISYIIQKHILSVKKE